MQIAKVDIKKFRSVQAATFNLGKITAVVGENNAGKTALMRALNAVLNYEAERNSFLTRRHQHVARSNTYISLWFSDVPDLDVYRRYVRNGQLGFRLVYEYSKGRERFEVEMDKGWTAAPEDLVAQIRHNLLFVYIPAERTEHDIACDEKAVFGDVVADYFVEQFRNRDTATSQVRNVSKKMHDAVLRKLEGQLNKLYMQGNLADFKIGFPEDLDYTVLLGSIQVSLNENESEYLMEEWGSGTKSLAIIAMHRAKALLKDANVVLAIEEPETNLHPQAQKRFIMSLRDNLDEKETQTIFTTHSTVLVDYLSHEDILLVRRHPDEKRGFCSVISQISSDFWDRYSLKEEKHYQFFRYRNSDFFFSKFVIVGESKNDCQVLERLLTNDLGMALADVSFLNAEGVDFIKYPYFLLKELEIPCAFVVDRDFFFPYRNGKLDNSRDDKTGLPKYSSRHKTDGKVLSVIRDLFPRTEEMQALEKAQESGYRKLFELLSSRGFLVMNYCLEMDLTCSAAARDAYYRICNVPVRSRSQKSLLVDYKDAIKKIVNIVGVLDSIPKASYPESYSKIRKALLEMVITNVGR